ncbi:MAG: PGN_0703 family putative restriction endonuclease [Bradymonadaceae bacterium]
MTRCPLTDDLIDGLVDRLPPRFTTLDFICACPDSGGTADARACSVVRDRGSRSVCGRRLSAFQKVRAESLTKDNSVSPAAWARGAGGSVAPTSAGVVKRRARAQPAGWEKRVTQHQIAWKENVVLVQERGVHNGEERDYLFPRERWVANILPNYRVAVAAHLKRHDIAQHSFLHHVRSSQAFALNLAAPFLEEPALLTPLLRELLPPELAGELDEVIRVEAEVMGGKNYFREPAQGGRGELRTSADLGVWWRTLRGETNLVLIEVKFTEEDFGHCAKGRKAGGPCDEGGAELVETVGRECPLTQAPHNRAYWELLGDHDVFVKAALARSSSCPFRHDGYQLMRSQLLGVSMEADRDEGLTRVDFAILIHDDNPSIGQVRLPGGSKDVTTGWSGLLTRPDRFHAWKASEWVRPGADHPALEAWAEAMFERYFPKTMTTVSPLSSPPGGRGYQRGHMEILDWMRGPEFLAYKKLCDEIIGPGMIYFRATKQGVVQIVLSDDAPGYVGFRTRHDDDGHLLTRSGVLPDRAKLQERWDGFRRWLPIVNRVSTEEQAVIPWVRRALNQSLSLEGLGEGWVFLNQEWRFLDHDGKGKKSDVLAVHLPTGRLGIVEAKDSKARRHEARQQLADYASFWTRDCEDLRHFFTAQLRTMGTLHGNAEAASARVSAEPAILFFCYPSGGDVVVERVTAQIIASPTQS